MSSFFTTPASQKKRKRNESTAPTFSKKKPINPKAAARDESISGSESESDGPHQDVDEFEDDEDNSSGSDDGNETAAERRLRLAERYLENIRQEVDEVGFDAEQIDRDLIAERLKEDVAESKGRLYRHIASDLCFGDASRTFFRADTHSTTSIAVCLPHVYTVSKDMTLIKWRVPSPPASPSSNLTNGLNGHTPHRKPAPPRRRPIQEAYVRGHKHHSDPTNTTPRHTAAILAVAASEDGKFVATGDADRRLIVWDAATLTPLKAFTHHRDAITSLCFRRGTNQLFSGSRDRTIKLWSLDELAYIETLFGHQDEIVDVASLALEQCVSVGARDRTARLWKVVDETQLVFRAGGGGGGRQASSAASVSTAVKPKVTYADNSVDAITLIDEQTFVTGSQGGSLALWTTAKKKPIFTVPLAHGLDPLLPASAYSAETDLRDFESQNDDDDDGDNSNEPRTKKSENSASVLPPQQPRWITALASVPYADLVLSGSWDGVVRAWRVTEDKRRLEPAGILPGPVPGVVNGIAIGERGERASEGLMVAVATGAECKGGKWIKISGRRNGGYVLEIPRRILKHREDRADDDGDEDDGAANDGK